MMSAKSAGARAGPQVCRAEGVEFRFDDRIRWTRNDAGLGLVISRTAEVAEIRDGRKLELATTTCSSATSTTPGPRPCTRFRGAPSTT